LEGYISASVFTDIMNELPEEYPSPYQVHIFAYMAHTLRGLTVEERHTVRSEGLLASVSREWGYRRHQVIRIIEPVTLPGHVTEESIRDIVFWMQDYFMDVAYVGRYSDGKAHLFDGRCESLPKGFMHNSYARKQRGQRPQPRDSYVYDIRMTM
jgi:hypothetical protein